MENQDSEKEEYNEYEDLNKLIFQGIEIFLNYYCSI